MSKEVFYFSHDYNARNDPKLMRVKMKYGMEGLGIYWCIIEMLYEQNGYIPLINIESIAYELHSECERITDVLRNYELFTFQDESFFSESILRRLETRKNKSDSARESAKKRWNDANAMRTQCGGNAIKKSKVKKNKEDKKYFDYSFVSSDWLSLFTEWVNYKKSRNEMYKTQDSLQACYRNLLKLSNNNLNKGREVIDQATGNNWAGLFPLKGGADQEEPFKLSIITGQQSK